MSMKIYELAKELGMASKELLLKANSMGVEAKSHMSAISDIDAVAVKNAVTRGRSGTETKIIKVAPRKNKKETDEDEPRVVVKAAVMRAASTGVRQKSDYGAKSPAKENLQTPKPLQGAVRRAVDGIPVDVVRIPAAARQPDEKEQELESAGRQPALKEAQPEQKTEVPVKTDKPENPDKIGKKAEIAMIPQSRRVERAEIEKEELESREEIARQAETAAGESAEKNEEALSKEGRERGKEQRQPVSREHADRKSQENRPRRPAGTGEGYERKPSRPAAAGVSRDERPSGSANTAGRARKPAVSARTPVNRAVRPAAGKVERKQPERAGTRRKDKDTSPSVKRVYHNVSLEKRSSKPKSRPRPQQKIESAETELMQDLAPGTMVINVPITVAGFAEQVERTTSEIIMKLMRLGVMANINQNIDEDTAMVLAEELDVPIVIGKNLGDLQEEGIESFEDKEEDLKSRPPVITVMGHVDHGKTSLLDAIRKTNVTMGEAGGITQHIGASEVTVNGERIVFLDTPGHEAFTAMRARGAHVTDIAVLVVAADDGVKPQTVESISHAKAAGVPVIVAINKIDKPGANPDRVRQELADQGILVEGWGGTTICVLVSAKSGEGIVSLLEMILLQAEILELRANPGRLGVGTVIEARLDRTKGPVATLLVLNGTLESGMYIVAGTTSGRVRAMTDGQGNLIRKAGPAAAVEILGLTEAPQAGDEFNALRDGVAAREIALNRKAKLREEVMARNSSTTLEKLFSQIQEGETRELNLIIKGDVQGSVGALDASLEKLRNENVRVKIVHTGVGTVTESDIMLASAAGAIIIAFNVRPGSAVSNMAKLENVEIRTYRVIYDVISDVEAAMKGMLDPVFHEVVLGEAEVRNIFRIPGAGVVAGAYVTEGKMLRNADIRLVRDGAVVLEGKIASLRRFKDDVREVVHSYECGIGIENYNDIKEGDVIEAFTMEETKRE